MINFILVNIMYFEYTYMDEIAMCEFMSLTYWEM